MIEEKELPSGWMFLSLNDLVASTSHSIKRGPFGSAIKKEFFVPKGYKVYEQKNVIYNNFDLGSYYIDEEKFNQLRDFEIKSGDIVISCSGTIGEIAIVPPNSEKGIINQALLKITLDETKISSKFFTLLFKFNLQKILLNNVRGSAMQNIASVQVLKQVLFPIPPLAEQQRIVSAIEQQFSRLDAGVAALQRVKAKLKRYRAAVLKAAVEGKLTETWRAEHPTTEPASLLLERILKERRAKWEDDLRAKGKDPAKVKYVEPAKPNVEGLPRLPDDWCWASVEQICGSITDCLHSTANFHEAGFVCVDTNCIKPGRILHEKVRYVDEATFIDRNRRMKPRENDVIFSREGALLGIAVRVPADFEFCLGQRMMIFRLNPGIDSKYYEIALNSSVFRSQYLKEISGTASPHLNIQDIRTFSIPIPSLIEQQSIVTEVESQMSTIEDLERVIITNLKRAERLRQSILCEAFAGRLVPQDPTDEPASVLLERIQSERNGQMNGAGMNNKKNRSIKVPEPMTLDVGEAEQAELWESVGN